jgi:glyoxylase-like metal-dependent hydrolase (beta-lactamase superfamily II)
MENASEFYSFRHGRFDITVLSDGPIVLGGEVFAPEGTDQQRDDILRRLKGDHSGAAAQSNIPLIITDEDLILIDVGAGTKFQPSEGHLEENLESVGVDAKDITAVIISHAHPDHLWGLLRDDQSLRFPNARYFVGRREFDFWTGPEAAALPDGVQPFVEGARRDLLAIAEIATLFEDGDEILRGITAIATPGHTAGHSSFLLDGDIPLIVTADAIASEIVSVEHPEWSFGFDMDVELAGKTRLSLLQKVAFEKAKLIGFHWSYPGVGRIAFDGTGYTFQAVTGAAL